MIDVEMLYTNEKFMKFLNTAINVNIQYFGDISERQDYINDVFLEIMECECDTFHECKKATWRVLERERRRLKAMPTSVLWEDNHILGAHYDAIAE